MKKFISGFVLGALLFGAIGAYASTKETISINRNVEKLIINDNSYEMGDKIFASDGTTYVPLRFLAETFNHIVEWDNSSKSVKIHLDPCMAASGIEMKPRSGLSGIYSFRETVRALCINQHAFLLPKDVYMDGLIVVNDYAGNDLTPAYVLKSGDRTITVSYNGILYGNDKSVLGSEFAFLSDYVRTEDSSP